MRITVLLSAILVPAILAWLWGGKDSPTIRLVGYRIEQEARKGDLGEELPPYQFKHAVFRITNPSSSTYSFVTVDNEPFYGGKFWEESGGTQTMLPSRDCGMVSISIREIAPEGTVDFEVPMMGILPEHKAFAVALPMFKGTAAEYDTILKKRTPLSGLMDYFRECLFPRYIPRAVWSDKLEAGRP